MNVPSGITRTPAYFRAFEEYLRRGTPIEWTLNSEARQTTHYVWRTRGDDRVRPTHQRNEGRLFAWSDPPEATGHPGEDFGCRCLAEPYVEGKTEFAEQVLLDKVDFPTGPLPKDMGKIDRG